MAEKTKELTLPLVNGCKHDIKVYNVHVICEDCLKELQAEHGELRMAMKGALEFYADGDGDAPPPWVEQARKLIV